MNDETKEILYKLDSISNGAYNNDGYVDLKQNEAHLLLDYITNLQEENKYLNNELNNMTDYAKDLEQENKYLKLSNPEMNIEHFRVVNENKKKIDNLRKQNKELQQENERLKENNQNMQEEMCRCWQRIDKAIEKMQYIIDYGFDYDGFNTVESLKGLIDMLVDYAKESKNILQNGSDDNE